jgi:hypothetical protein
MSFAFGALQRHILIVKAHLLSDELDAEVRRRILIRSMSGLIPYAVATAVAPFSANTALAICAGLALYYALPIASNA